MISKAVLYMNTIKYLQPRQIRGQLYKPFAMKQAYNVGRNCPEVRQIKTVIPSLDLDTAYLSRFNVKDIMSNKFTLLSETHLIDLRTWDIQTSPLWQFNMHYFEYVIALAAEYVKQKDNRYYNKVKELVSTWINAHPVGRGAAWHPYTISMRIPNWMICFDLLGDIFVQDTSFRAEVIQSIYAQYRTLLKRQEIWQLGNHYFENLKTILLCSLMFREDDVTEKYTLLLLKEIKEEVLPDGVHFELSLMYHKISMEDLLRIMYWMRQAKMPESENIKAIINRMADAIYSLELGMGHTPLFNDSGDGVSKETSAILRSVCELTRHQAERKHVFHESGYYKLHDGPCSLIFDAGKIGPDYMPGHGHCDCLSFEMSLNNKPLFVNSGTYQYQCQYRGYFRSTRAHNTLTVCGHDQSECWGEHRVARRLYDIEAQYSSGSITGSYTNYLGDKHVRNISLADGCLQVLDSVSANTSGTVRSYLHIAPMYYVKEKGSMLEVWHTDTKVCDIEPIDCRYLKQTDGELSLYSSAFGVLEHGTCLEFVWDTDNQQHGYKVVINGGHCK